MSWVFKSNLCSREEKLIIFIFMYFYISLISYEIPLRPKGTPVYFKIRETHIITSM
jgi:hypothetical protein